MSSSMLLSSPLSWRNKVTEADIQRAKDAYLKSEKVPMLQQAHVTKSGDFYEIRSLWSQPSVIANKNRNFSRTYTIKNDESSFFGSRPLPVNGLESITAFSEDEVITEYIIYKTKNVKNDDVVLLEIWKPEGLTKTFNLTDLDLHGPVYFDGEFGSLKVNKAGNKLAYVAEEKRPKAAAFFKRTSKESSDSYVQTVGTEFGYVEEWGEQLVGKSQPVIVTLNLETEEFKVWSGEDHLPSDVSVGQLIWAGDDSLIGVAVRTEPRRLGIVYCSNRRSAIFQLNVADEADPSEHRYREFSSGKTFSVTSPRLSPDGNQLVWFERQLSVDAFPGPHQACFRLVTINLADPKPEIRVVVPFVSHHEPRVDDFGGIFLWGGDIPSRCFVNSKTIFFSTYIVDLTYPILVDLDSGNLTVLKEFPHLGVLDVDGNNHVAVGVLAEPTSSPQLFLGKVDTDTKSIRKLFIDPQEKSKSLNEEVIWKSFVHVPKVNHPDPAFGKVKFNSIYIGVAAANKASVPLIVWPHGGPHSVTVATFYRQAVFFNSLGYAILLVNYRGSLGAGEDSVNSLLGHVGDTDVKDCHQAVEECLETFSFLDDRRVFLFGGSHGGFLVTHLAGQYPDLFRAVVARNPVINIATMATVSDIPDWTFNEAGLAYEYKSPSAGALKLMYEKSPINHVTKIKAPIFLMIGKEDLRVPPSQGIEFYHTLKGLGKEVYMNLYEDNHPLAKVAHDSNVLINTVLFYEAVVAGGDSAAQDK